jgi:hypothetical protein
MIRDSSQADGHHSVFTSGAYSATTPDVAFPQEKPHFAELDRGSVEVKTL